MNPDLILHYDRATLRQAAASKADGHASVSLRMLNGEDDIAISEAMLHYDDDGRVQLSNAASESVKLCRSVGAISGLTIDGVEIGALTPETYKIVPRWMIIKMRVAASLLDLDPAQDAVLPE